MRSKKKSPAIGDNRAEVRFSKVNQKKLITMAYSPINHLRVVYFIQEYAKEKQAIGLPNTRIVKNVSNIYPITINTFYDYMRRAAKKELRQMDVDMAELDKQKDYIISIIPN